MSRRSSLPGRLLPASPLLGACTAGVQLRRRASAPDHASAMSGRRPVRIASDPEGVNAPDAPLLGAADVGASPFRERGTARFDLVGMRPLEPPDGRILPLRP